MEGIPGSQCTSISFIEPRHFLPKYSFKEQLPDAFRLVFTGSEPADHMHVRTNKRDCSDNTHENDTLRDFDIDVVFGGLGAVIENKRSDNVT